MQSFPATYACVNEPLMMTRTPGIRLSVVPQLHLSAPPSHFKSRKLIELFFISLENETGGERVAESAAEPLLWLHSSSPDNPATTTPYSQNTSPTCLPPRARIHTHTPQHFPLIVPSQQAPLLHSSTHSFFIHHLLRVYCSASSNRCT